MSGYESGSDRVAKVLYGTETGNSQDLAHEVGRRLERYHFTTDVEEFGETSPQSLGCYALVVFVLSTTGQGDFPSNARKFWTSLLRKKLTATFLATVKYALVGLGDSSYPKFNWAARKLDKRLKQLGAFGLLEPCEADEQGEDSTEGAFISWLPSFNLMLEKQYPLRDGLFPISDDQAIPSKWTLSMTTESSELDEAGYDMNLQPHLAPHPTDGQDTPITVTVLENTRVTPREHWQDVRYLRLSPAQIIEYLPGDALAIRPQNAEEDVNELIDLMGWQDLADSPLAFIPHSPKTSSLRSPHTSMGTGHPVSIRRLLTRNMDINAIPRRSFFSAIARYTDNEMHKERLLEFTDPQFLDEYYDYATRPRRSIIEVLQEFDSVKIPWEELINVLPVLRPRQFSIASGGQQKEGGTCFDLLVAIVKYKTVIKRIRQGVCTKYLAQLPVGSKMTVFLKTEGRLQTKHQLCREQHLLIGVGTGMAPLRALVNEKLSMQSQMPTTFFFGCRNASADFFFQEEWQALDQHGRPGAEGLFRMITAFSRDQKLKVYVQDRIVEKAAKVQALLLDKSTTVVVCGSSGAMPKAVRQALIDVLCSRQSDTVVTFSSSEAEHFLAKLEKEGRFKQETW